MEKAPYINYQVIVGDMDVVYQSESYNDAVAEFRAFIIAACCKGSVLWGRKVALVLNPRQESID